ncbi:MAG: CPBP family intramembrane metalloprotease [Verrucomicrobiales bacterium]|nr:CPBP family intramembrane metalloprotease [Verrucomicrobiales bacterium]
MSPLWALLLYLIWILIGGGLVAPWVWWGTQALAAAYGDAWIQGLAGHPFHRYVHRCLLAFAIMGLPWLSRALGIRRWQEAGFCRHPGGDAVWRQWQGGVLLGLAMFVPALALEWAAGVRAVRWPGSGFEVLSKTLEILAGAIVVGVLEESLFRGVLFGGLQRSMGAVRALLISSLAYAVVHFFERPAPPAAVTWVSGFEAVAQMLGGFARWDRLVPYFGTLTGAGMLLGRLYQVSGSLWLPMGVHTGWVVALKARGWLTHRPSATIGHHEIPLWDWLCLAGIGLVLLASLTRRTRGSGKEI